MHPFKTIVQAVRVLPYASALLITEMSALRLAVTNNFFGNRK
jgi:hypothetical protein